MIAIWPWRQKRWLTRGVRGDSLVVALVPTPYHVMFVILLHCWRIYYAVGEVFGRALVNVTSEAAAGTLRITHHRAVVSLLTNPLHKRLVEQKGNIQLLTIHVAGVILLRSLPNR